MKEKFRKLAEGYEASLDYDKAIFVWEQKIGDFEEAARVRGLKADYSTAAASVELPPPRDNQAILLAILAFIFLGLTVWFFLSIDNSSFWNSPIPCCCSSVLFLIFGMWATKITEENKAAKDSVIAEKVQEVERQRKAVEEEKLRKQRARERSQRRKAMRQEANQRERALDYNSAIRIWEELGQIKEAARVRKLKAEQSAVKVDQTVIHGDYVDDRDTTYIDDRDTIVKDSVISRSNIGSGGDDKLTKIKELKELHDAGAIDDAEFKQMKKEILG